MTQQDVVRQMADDTNVCRKICLGRHNRSDVETLSELPMFCSRYHERLFNDDLPPKAVTDGLPGKVFEDLRRRSKEAILDKMLNGDYGLLGESDETQDT